jgi:hypothetical protein
VTSPDRAFDAHGTKHFVDVIGDLFEGEYLARSPRTAVPGEIDSHNMKAIAECIGDGLPHGAVKGQAVTKDQRGSLTLLEDLDGVSTNVDVA